MRPWNFYHDQTLIERSKSVFPACRLAASGKLSSIQADWEDLQMDMMLQDSAANKAKATAAAVKRAERRGRAEIDADAVLPAAGQGRTVSCASANSIRVSHSAQLRSHVLPAAAAVRVSHL
jgi:hypothetical protein